MNMFEQKIDYSPHYLSLEGHLRTVYNLLKENNFEEAVTYAELMAVEARLLRNAIKTHVKQ